MNSAIAARTTSWRRRLIHHDLRDLTAPLALPETELPKLVHGTIIILAISLLVFLIWASVTPIREIAHTEGQIIPSGYNQIVQHLDGGLVREIIVQEGDFVQKDQVLLRINGAGAEEDLKEQQLLITRLELQAERQLAIIEKREPDFKLITSNSQVIIEQMQTHEANQRSRLADLNVLQEQLAQRERSLVRLQATLSTASANQKLAQEALGIYTELINKGLTNRTNYLRRREEYNVRRGEVAEATQQIQSARREIDEYKRRMEALDSQHNSNAYEQLHALRTEIEQRKQELIKRDRRAERLDVRSPTMGYVKGLRVNTVGSVIPAGSTIMEIVPVNEKLVAEIRILPEEIGRVHVGQRVQVKIDSYDYVRFGIIEGRLQSISATTFADEAQRQDYYKGRVLLERNFIGHTPGLNILIPGMTVNADIVTGEKTIMSYLLRPIKTAMQNALTEQ